MSAVYDFRDADMAQVGRFADGPQRMALGPCGTDQFVAALGERPEPFGDLGKLGEGIHSVALGVVAAGEGFSSLGPDVGVFVRVVGEGLEHRLSGGTVGGPLCVVGFNCGNGCGLVGLPAPAVVGVVLHVEPLVVVAAGDLDQVLAAGAGAGGPDDLASAGVADVDGEAAVLGDRAFGGVALAAVGACRHASSVNRVTKDVNR